jgi:predicted RNA-binding Zn-ribbon protein involved in translation (DUF1610 family)
METNNNEVLCPKCGSNQITANKKGFSGGKALAGVVLTGGIGLLAGGIGRNKIQITCLNCGNQFKPGDRKINKPFTMGKPSTPPRLMWDENLKQHVENPEFKAYISDPARQNKLKKNSTIGKVFAPVFAIVALIMFFSKVFFMGVIMLVLAFFFFSIGRTSKYVK